MREALIQTLMACLGSAGFGVLFNVHGSKLLWGGELFITCTLQQVHFGGETMKKGSFQCLMKQRTLTLLRETLLCLSFSIFSSFCRWLQLQTSKTCSIF